MYFYCFLALMLVGNCALSSAGFITPPITEEPCCQESTTISTEKPCSTESTTTSTEKPCSTESTTTSTEKSCSTVTTITSTEKPCSTESTTTSTEKPCTTATPIPSTGGPCCTGNCQTPEEKCAKQSCNKNCNSTSAQVANGGCRIYCYCDGKLTTHLDAADGTQVGDYNYCFKGRSRYAVGQTYNILTCNQEILLLSINNPCAVDVYQISTGKKVGVSTCLRDGYACNADGNPGYCDNGQCVCQGYGYFAPGFASVSSMSSGPAVAFERGPRSSSAAADPKAGARSSSAADPKAGARSSSAAADPKAGPRSSSAAADSKAGPRSSSAAAADPKAGPRSSSAAAAPKAGPQTASAPAASETDPRMAQTNAASSCNDQCQTPEEKCMEVVGKHCRNLTAEVINCGCAINCYCNGKLRTSVPADDYSQIGENAICLGGQLLRDLFYYSFDARTCQSVNAYVGTKNNSCEFEECVAQIYSLTTGTKVGESYCLREYYPCNADGNSGICENGECVCQEYDCYDY